MSDQHAETLKYEATEIERLEAELATANAKIVRVEEACEGTYCYDADDTHDPLDRCVNEVIGDIRAALADPAPGEPK